MAGWPPIKARATRRSWQRRWPATSGEGHRWTPAPRRWRAMHCGRVTIFNTRCQKRPISGRYRFYRDAMTDGLPLTHSYNLARLGNAVDEVTFAADESQCAAIARWSGVLSVQGLSVTVDIKKL